MQMFKQLAVLMMATEATPLRIANVEFWIDGEDMVYFPDTTQWDAKAMGESVEQLSKVYPEVVRIVAQYQ